MERNKKEIIGNMDTLITIQRITETDDEFGAKTISWNDVSEVWSSIEYSSTKSDEGINGGLDIATTAIEFGIRFDIDMALTQKDRIKYINQFGFEEIYDIQIIKAPDRNGHLVITALAAF